MPHARGADSRRARGRRSKDFEAVAELRKPCGRRDNRSTSRRRTKEARGETETISRGAACAVSSPRQQSRGQSRREPETLRLRAIEPALTVDDINRSLTFYTDVLGFFVSDRFTDKSGVLLGAMLKGRRVRRKPVAGRLVERARSPEGQGLSLWFHTAQDVDALAKRITAAGGRLVEGPTARRMGRAKPDRRRPRRLPSEDLRAIVSGPLRCART